MFDTIIHPDDARKKQQTCSEAILQILQKFETTTTIADISAISTYPSKTISKNISELRKQQIIVRHFEQNTAGVRIAIFRLRPNVTDYTAKQTAQALLNPEQALVYKAISHHGTQIKQLIRKTNKTTHQLHLILTHLQKEKLVKKKYLRKWETVLGEKQSECQYIKLKV